jgi:hypothetical protein
MLCLSEYLTSTTVISLRVNVPVLSTHTTEAQPSASTAGSFFTTALRKAMRCDDQVGN